MKLLVMGGTLFLGRHIIEAAIQRGHQVTSFNRGLQNPTLFPEIEKLVGDRDKDLTALRGRRFDAVIDPSAYTPGQVDALLRTLDTPPDHYTFISSVSAYRTFPPGVCYTEDAARVEGDTGYGPLKARTEDALIAALPENRLAILRPGLIVGPHDPTDRFTYWVRRIDAGGRVLAPGRPDRPIQFIDARDLADWALHLAESRIHGVYNAVGPQTLLTMGSFLQTCQATIGQSVEFQWIPDQELIAAGAQPWTGLPLWLPEEDTDDGGLFLADNQRAVRDGLRFRPIADTVADTLAWARSAASAPRSPLAVETLTPEDERRLLLR
ncbi:MAG: NAD-dependent epimerase/dehydratase family protein [Janthinobacterium lividum]